MQPLLLTPPSQLQAIVPELPQVVLVLEFCEVLEDTEGRRKTEWGPTPSVQLQESCGVKPDLVATLGSSMHHK